MSQNDLQKRNNRLSQDLQKGKLSESNQRGGAGKLSSDQKSGNNRNGEQLNLFEQQPLTNRSSRNSPSGDSTHTGKHSGGRGDRGGVGNSGGRGLTEQKTRPQLNIFDQPTVNNEAEGNPLAASLSEPPKVISDVRPIFQYKGLSEKERLIDIIAAIDTLKKVEQENRAATAKEKERLAKFTGFGPVANVAFRDAKGNFKKGYEALAGQLESLLSVEELRSAERSTYNAFYTSPLVMKAMYKALGQLGLPKQESISILEPGCGIGNFIGASENSQYQFIGVEKEAISARIAKLLYPEQTIIHKNFEAVDKPTKDGQPLLRDESVDAVIGNVPFAELSLRYSNGKQYSLHDYFFLKSLDKLRPGGVLALITSAYTMDKKDASLRGLLAEKAHLIAAIRLPNQAFKNQGTEVLTDILIFQKNALEKEYHNRNWLETSQVSLNENGDLIPSESGVIHINNYYLHHPGHILGDKRIGKKQYARESLQVRLLDSATLENKLNQIIESLPRAVYLSRPEQTPKPLALIDISPTAESSYLKEGSFYLEDDKIMQYSLTGANPLIYAGKPLTIKTKLGKRIKDYIRLRNAVREVIVSQKDNLPSYEKEQARQKLKKEYDHFIAQHGPINKIKTSISINKKTNEERKIIRYLNLQTLKKDPDVWLVSSIENFSEAEGASKGPIFFKDILSGQREITVSSAEEGLLASINLKGEVDLAYIADLVKGSEKQIIEKLTNKENPLIYFDPRKEAYITKEDYLSGHLRNKLAALTTYEQQHPDSVLTKGNREALESRLPSLIPAEEISINLGAGWVDPKFVKQFAEETLGGKWKIHYIKENATWLADLIEKPQLAQDTDPYSAAGKYGYEIFKAALQSQSINIYDKVSDGNGGTKQVPNSEKTLAVEQAKERIEKTFTKWVYEDPKRVETLTKKFNETFNSTSLRSYDGSFLDFKGMNPAIELKKHQKDAVLRLISQPSTLLAHATGAGKTFAMQTAGMKMKQMGLRNKPLYVVPNHMLEQFSKEFLLLYPSANLLIATKEDLTKENRQKFTAKAATANWDGIVITHSSFDKIMVSLERQEDYIQRQIDIYQDLLRSVEDQLSKKSIQKSLDRLESKLKTTQEKTANQKDAHIYFEELGIDHLFIDEAHLYKNLAFQTKMDRVAGLNPTGSERAFNLHMITEYLHSKEGSGITFATATPLTNSITEMYTFMRYLNPKAMEEMGIAPFDAWAKTFGEVVAKLEIKPDARTIAFKQRFAKFHNVPELLTLFREFTDIKRPNELDLKVPTAKFHIISAESSEALKNYQLNLQSRYQAVKNRAVEPKIDNALKISTDGRLAALDPRLVDPLAHDDPNSKVNKCVDQVYTIWKQNQANKATQMIFSDTGVHVKEDRISVYEDIIEKLVIKGIPREEIANINDYPTDQKKEALFAKLRKGEVRVILGSTTKMGAGTNVQSGTFVNGKMQGGLIALHHLDAPWRPADIEQREGRIIRQNNPHKSVNIYRYITKDSFDAVMWQKLEMKQHFIHQVMSAKGQVGRTMEDIHSKEALDFAEVAAIASGNPEILKLAEIEATLKALQLDADNYGLKVKRQQLRLNGIPEKLMNYYARLKGFDLLIAIRDQAIQEKTIAKKEQFSIEIEGRKIVKPVEANDFLKRQVRYMTPINPLYTKKLIFRGIHLEVERPSPEDFRLVIKNGNQSLASSTFSLAELTKEGTNLISRIKNLTASLEQKREALHKKVENLKKEQIQLSTFIEQDQLQAVKNGSSSGFPAYQRLAELKEEKARIESLLVGRNEVQISDHMQAKVVSDFFKMAQSSEEYTDQLTMYASVYQLIPEKMEISDGLFIKTLIKKNYEQKAELALERFGTEMPSLIDLQEKPEFKAFINESESQIKVSLKAIQAILRLQKQVKYSQDQFTEALDIVASLIGNPHFSQEKKNYLATLHADAAQRITNLQANTSLDNQSSASLFEEIFPLSQAQIRAMYDPVSQGYIAQQIDVSTKTIIEQRFFEGPSEAKTYIQACKAHYAAKEHLLQNTQKLVAKAIPMTLFGELEKITFIRNKQFKEEFIQAGKEILWDKKEGGVEQITVKGAEAYQAFMQEIEAVMEIRKLVFHDQYKDKELIKALRTAKTLLSHNSYIQTEELKEIQFFVSAVEKRLGHRLDETPPAEQQVESPYSYVRLPTDQQKDTMIEQAFLTDEKAELARVYLNKEGNYTLECWDMEAEEMPFGPYTYKYLGSARKEFQKQMGYVSYTQDLSEVKKSLSAEEIEM